MKYLLIILVCAAVLVSGLLGITLSVPLQAPAVLLFGMTAVLASFHVWKRGSLPLAGERQRASGNWLLVLVSLATLYFAVRAWFSPVRDLGVEDLMLILPTTVLYLLAGYVWGGKKGIVARNWLAGTVIVLLLLHLGSACLQLTGSDGYSLTKFFTGATRASQDHVTGMYGYYGSFANFAVIAGLLSLSLGIWGRLHVVLRPVLVVVGSVAIALAVYSQSRSALIALIPSLLVFMVLLFLSVSWQPGKVRRLVRGGVVVFGVLFSFVGLAAGSWVFSERSQNPGLDGIERVFASDARLTYWSMAAEQWLDYPWVGAGSRSYSYLCFRYWNPNLRASEPNPEFVHNEYLQVLADYGLIGLLLLVVLLFWHLTIGFRRVGSLAEKVPQGGFLRGSNAMALAIAGTSGLTAMAVHVCVDFRTHLLANLLLLVCCAVWVLPITREQKNGAEAGGIHKARGVLIFAVLIIFGVGSLRIGWQQLWAGLPLLEKRMAKEDGAWRPQSVDRNVWIPALEASLKRMPHWRRFERLGVLYQLEAELVDDVTSKVKLGKAKDAYLASIDLHPYNPIPQINLAMIYTAAREWEQADAAYEKISQKSVAREHWFRAHQRWGEMHRLWAKDLWSEGSAMAAEKHYERSQQLYLKSRQIATPRDLQWRNAYFSVSFEYIYFLLSEKRYDEALNMIEKFEIKAGKARLLRIRADYYFHYGKSLWHARKTGQALTCLYKARENYTSCKRRNRGAMDEHWRKNYEETKEIIRFLEKAGIKRAPIE